MKRFITALILVVCTLKAVGQQETSDCRKSLDYEVEFNDTSILRLIDLFIDSLETYEIEKEEYQIYVRLEVVPETGSPRLDTVRSIKSMYELNGEQLYVTLELIEREYHFSGRIGVKIHRDFLLVFFSLPYEFKEVKRLNKYIEVFYSDRLNYSCSTPVFVQYALNSDKTGFYESIGYSVDEKLRRTKPSR